MFLVWPGCSTVAGLLDGPPVDSDGDGLTDDVEEELGLDPASEDSDGDRLWDDDEFMLGTDPAVADTDGDGYDDGDELLEARTRSTPRR